MVRAGPGRSGPKKKPGRKIRSGPGQKKNALSKSGPVRSGQKIQSRRLFFFTFVQAILHGGGGAGPMQVGSRLHDGGGTRTHASASACTWKPFGIVGSAVRTPNGLRRMIDILLFLDV